VPRLGSIKNLGDKGLGDSGSDRSGSGELAVAPPELVEVTLKKGSNVVGQSIRASAFRSRFHAAVVAIKRNGMPLKWTGTYIGDEVLKVSSHGRSRAALMLAASCFVHRFERQAPSGRWPSAP
jgi:hypothetical protein